jgi:carnitine 3-dehydrogenase
MSVHRTVRRVAIVGTGVIGASWATQFLARGLDVVATDPMPDAEAKLREYVDGSWSAASAIGLSPDASRSRLSFTPDMREAVADSDFVQENAPERPDLKVKLFTDIDDAAPADAIIASSSSGITMSVIQAGCKHPERTVIGHPVNPPHLIPLVEVVGGTWTAPETVSDAIAFYRWVGKRPIHLKKELPGHVVNRLQAALYREIVYLIEKDVLDVSDSDDALSWGPGLRWGLMGQNLLWHLGGGPDGIAGFMEKFMDPLVASWPALGTPEVTPELKQRIIDGVHAEAAGRSIEELAATRDEMLIALQNLRVAHEKSPEPAGQSAQ